MVAIGKSAAWREQPPAVVAGAWRCPSLAGFRARRAAGCNNGSIAACVQDR